MINIRSYEKGDEKGIVELFNEVYETSREVNYWKWQFMDSPIGKPIIIVAEEDSKIIGHCALIPNLININGEEVLVGESIDTMISKDYRGQGLYKKMSIKSYEVGKLEGMKMRIGFPTKELYKGLFSEEIDAKFVTEVPLFINIYRMDNFLVRIVRLKLLAKILSVPILLISKFIYKEKKIKIKNDYIIKEVQEFTEEFDLLWDKIKDESTIMKSRSSKFLNWRIANHPEFVYKIFAAYLNNELVGYNIIKTEKRKIKNNVDLNVGTIVDIIGINEEVVGALYFKSKEYFKSIKIDFVVSWASETMKYRQLLIYLGFYKTKHGLPFVVKDLSNNQDLNEYISEEKNWYLMPIESDIY